MKLKDTIQILEDSGKLLEVVGEYIPYEYKKHKFQLMVHESIQPWTPNVMDISEVTTGCRCTSTGKPVSSSTKADIVEAMDAFIEKHGLRNLQQEIKKRRLTSDMRCGTIRV